MHTNVAAEAAKELSEGAAAQQQTRGPTLAASWQLEKDSYNMPTA